MDDFNSRVEPYLVGGDNHDVDRAGGRRGLFAAIQQSTFYEFLIVRDHAGTRAIIAGGDREPREFSIEFGLEPGPIKARITREDIKATHDRHYMVVAILKDTAAGDVSLEMTRRSAVALYNLAAAG
jgi:hypothetical protein